MQNITDMSGRTVELPDKINKIYAPSPYASTLLMSLCPEKLCGLFFPIEEYQKPYLNPCLFDLPVIGKVSEIEAIKKANPDVILIWGDKSSPIHQKSEKVLVEIGIPHIYACADELVNLYDYPAVYRFLGKVLEIEERTEKLATYCEKTLDEVSELVNSVHPQNRPRVYYAEGKDGTQTEYSHSLHAHLLNLIGDVNIHRGTLDGHAGMEQLTEEQLLKYNPEVIIVWLEEAYKVITQKTSMQPRNDDMISWEKISAVMNNRLYLIPKEPFSYFDRPPCFMRILGLKWLLSICYPNLYNKNFEEEKAEFLKLFFGMYS